MNKILTIHQYLKEMFKDRPVWGEIEKPQFRGSALPICPIKWVLTSILAHYKVKVKRQGMYSDYFLAEGTLIHELLQRYMGPNKILYGKWKCKTCKRVIGPQLGSEVCHGAWMTYEEYTLVDPISGILIHIDAMLRMNKYKVLGDFKTSKSAWKKDYKVPSNYYHQLNCYYHVAKQQKMDFDFTSLIYVPRDFMCLNPKNWILHPITPKFEDWQYNIDAKKLGERIVKYRDWSLFKKSIDAHLCTPGEGDEHCERCMFMCICHPTAHLNRMVHYKEICLPFLE